MNKDVLSVIFNFLDQREARMLGSTCKITRSVYKTYSHLNSLNIKDPRDLRKIDQHRSRLNSVTISGINNLDYYLNYLPRRAVIDHCYFNKFPFIDPIPSLKSLDIVLYNTPTLDYGLLPNLEELRIHCSTDSLITKGINKCSKLRVLIIYRDYETISNISEDVLALPNLEVLAINGVITTSKTKVFLERLKTFNVKYPSTLFISSSIPFNKVDDKEPLTKKVSDSFDEVKYNTQDEEDNLVSYFCNKTREEDENEEEDDEYVYDEDNDDFMEAPFVF